MLLTEFFGKSIDINKELSKKRDDKGITDEVFWYIIDHDKLHKDHFHDIADKIKKTKDHDKESLVRDFMPMVHKGCREFYHHRKMPGKFEHIFTKDMALDLCERLYDHYREDVVKGEYEADR
jgi:hypothetical protein